MRQVYLPKWLNWIGNNARYITIPYLPIFLTVIQVVGFLAVYINPGFSEKLILNPEMVLQGEVWRVVTFIAVPLVDNFLVILILWFFYDIMVWLEQIWGSTLLTVYFLVAWFSAAIASLLFGISIDTFFYMEISIFFALATLVPDRQIHLFFILPIAFKHIALFIAIVLLVIPLFFGFYSKYFYIILLFSNYLLFFGADYLQRFRNELKKRKKLLKK